MSVFCILVMRGDFMKSKHQSLLILAGTALVATIAVAVSSTNNSALFNSFADTPSKDRTLTLNNTTPLEVVGTVGTLIVGNMSVYAKGCSSIANGVGNLGYDGTTIYCNNADLKNDYYQGFGSSTIASLTIEYNNNNKAGEIFIGWGRMNEAHSMSFNTSGTSTTISSTANLENQTYTLSSGTAFINYQDTAKSSGYSCIYIYAKSMSFHFDLISLTVEYTCK